jgi:hypothetical protein
MMTLAIGLTRWWVRLYTKGLPPQTRDARRAEMESDLWEQGEDAGANGSQPDETALQVLVRLLLGIPADLSWRLEAGRRSGAAKGTTILGMSKSMGAAMLQKGLLGLTVLLAALYIAGGVGFTVGYVSGSLDWEVSALEAVYFGAIPFTSAAMILLGLFISKRSPWLGTSLVAIGAVAMTALWFWLFFILVPLTIVVIAFAVFRARRLTQERDRIAPA